MKYSGEEIEVKIESIEMGGIGCGDRKRRRRDYQKEAISNLPWIY